LQHKKIKTLYIKMRKKSTTIAGPGGQRKTNITGCRIPVEWFEKYEARCIRDHITMSKVLRDAVRDFIEAKV